MRIGFVDVIGLSSLRNAPNAIVLVPKSWLCSRYTGSTYKISHEGDCDEAERLIQKLLEEKSPHEHKNEGSAD